MSKRSGSSAGIRKKTLLYFLLFSAIIVILLWALQLLFFNAFYATMKRNEIKKNADAIVEHYGTSTFKEYAEVQAFKNDMTVLVFNLNRDNNTATATVTFHAGKMPDKVVEKLDEFLYYLDDNNKVSYVTQGAPGVELYTYGVVLEAATSTYLYVNASVMPLNNSTAVLMNQLMFITGICLLMACLISFYLSRKIAAPIEQVTMSARELAKGNLDVDFTTEGYHEITELSNTLNYATAELRKTDQLRKDLISNVSHELRTPLTLIKAYAELIKDISGNNEVKREEHLNVILTEAERLKVLVNDIMELSMLQANTFNYNKSQCCLSTTCNRVFNMFKGIYESQGYQFECDIEDNVTILCDENRIEQVIFNLVANAVNYSAERKWVSLKLSSNGQSARLQVSDKGMGIAAEDIPYIFDKFFKTEQAKRTKVGSGVGLSIVKNILDAHDFGYGVESEVGEGSTFYVDMPQVSSAE